MAGISLPPRKMPLQASANRAEQRSGVIKGSLWNTIRMPVQAIGYGAQFAKLVFVAVCPRLPVIVIKKAVIVMKNAVIANQCA